MWRSSVSEVEVSAPTWAECEDLGRTRRGRDLIDNDVAVCRVDISTGDGFAILHPQRRHGSTGGAVLVAVLNTLYRCELPTGRYDIFIHRVSARCNNAAFCRRHAGRGLKAERRRTTRQSRGISKRAVTTHSLLDDIDRGLFDIGEGTDDVVTSI